MEVVISKKELVPALNQLDLVPINFKVVDVLTRRRGEETSVVLVCELEIEE